MPKTTTIFGNAVLRAQDLCKSFSSGTWHAYEALQEIAELVAMSSHENLLDRPVFSAAFEMCPKGPLSKRHATRLEDLFKEMPEHLRANCQEVVRDLVSGKRNDALVLSSQLDLPSGKGSPKAYRLRREGNRIIVSVTDHSLNPAQRMREVSALYNVSVESVAGNTLNGGGIFEVHRKDSPTRGEVARVTGSEAWEKVMYLGENLSPREYVGEFFQRVRRDLDQFLESRGVSVARNPALAVRLAIYYGARETKQSSSSFIRLLTRPEDEGAAREQSAQLHSGPIAQLMASMRGSSYARQNDIQDETFLTGGKAGKTTPFSNLSFSQADVRPEELQTPPFRQALLRSELAENVDTIDPRAIIRSAKAHLSQSTLASHARGFSFKRGEPTFVIDSDRFGADQLYQFLKLREIETQAYHASRKARESGSHPKVDAQTVDRPERARLLKQRIEALVLELRFAASRASSVSSQEGIFSGSRLVSSLPTFSAATPKAGSHTRLQESEAIELPRWFLHQVRDVSRELMTLSQREMRASHDAVLDLSMALRDAGLVHGSRALLKSFAQQIRDGRQVVRSTILLSSRLPPGTPGSDQESGLAGAAVDPKSILQGRAAPSRNGKLAEYLATAQMLPHERFVRRGIHKKSPHLFLRERVQLAFRKLVHEEHEIAARLARIQRVIDRLKRRTVTSRDIFEGDRERLVRLNRKALRLRKRIVILIGRQWQLSLIDTREMVLKRKQNAARRNLRLESILIRRPHSAAKKGAGILRLIALSKANVKSNRKRLIKKRQRLLRMRKWREKSQRVFTFFKQLASTGTHEEFSDLREVFGSQLAIRLGCSDLRSARERHQSVRQKLVKLIWQKLKTRTAMLAKLHWNADPKVTKSKGV